MNPQKTKLKMTLKEIRDSINLQKTKWKHTRDTNCYAFALGLDVEEDKIIEHAYIPGTISNSEIKIYDFFDNNEYFNYIDFINNLYNDLEALKITFKEINPNDKTSESSWKIAIYITPHQQGCQDFHFLRLCDDKIWHHKGGYYYAPTIYDDNNTIITNINTCLLKNRTYKKCLSLKLN